MAIDPFVQQVTRFQSGPIQVPKEFSIIPSRRLFDAGLSFSNVESAITDPMKAAIYQGLFHTAAKNDSLATSALAPHPACTTGNCTFPAFETLAVCSKCANITDKLQRNWFAEQVLNVDLYTYDWYLPNGFRTGEVNMNMHSQDTMNASASHDPITLKAGLSLVNFTTIYVPGSKELTKADSPDFPVSATAEECMLYWCVKKYRSRIMNGMLSEDLLSTTTDGGDDIENLYHFKPEGSTARFNIPSARFSDVNLNNSVTGFYPQGNITGTFLVNKNASTLITRFFQENFEGGSESPTVKRFETGGLSTVFDWLALSMSTEVRGPGSDTVNTAMGADNVTIIGITTTTVTFMHVNWWWLTLPVVLEVATGILLLVTAVKSRQLKVWKSSALAKMFHGLAEEEMSDEKVERYVDMERVAKEKTVVLRRTVDDRQRLEVFDGTKK